MSRTNIQFSGIGFVQFLPDHRLTSEPGPGPRPDSRPSAVGPFIFLAAIARRRHRSAAVIEPEFDALGVELDVAAEDVPKPIV
ncbi:MAG: hypothetical protein R3233_11085, partial [Xanthomonadales bacterium]|nr:hypothetical protein [Xanthomonadales bacterium]